MGKCISTSLYDNTQKASDLVLDATAIRSSVGDCLGFKCGSGQRSKYMGILGDRSSSYPHKYACEMYLAAYTVTLRRISQYEKDFTETDRQRGILLKGLFVMAINWIIPIVVTNVVNENKNFYALSSQSY